jgi:hypothetical protein
MAMIARQVHTLLHDGIWPREDDRVIRHAVFVALVCGLAYGAVMGTFSGFWSGRVLQILYSALKVPILLLLTFLISLPSFFVFNALAGLRDDFLDAIGVLVGGQAALAVVLVSLAPLTIFWYASFSDYRGAVLYNGAMFAIASFGGQIVLRRGYAVLIARNPRHQLMLRVWLGVYVFVGIQMAWVLRPFIGDPANPTRFFREDAWSNAYVLIARLIWGLF